MACCAPTSQNHPGSHGEARCPSAGGHRRSSLPACLLFSARHRGGEKVKIGWKLRLPGTTLRPSTTAPDLPAATTSTDRHSSLFGAAPEPSESRLGRVFPSLRPVSRLPFWEVRGQLALLHATGPRGGNAVWVSDDPLQRRPPECIRTTALGPHGPIPRTCCSASGWPRQLPTQTGLPRRAEFCPGSSGAPAPR